MSNTGVDFWKSNMRTGRTSRLIEEAKKLSAEGRAVYIVAASVDHARNMRRIHEITGSSIKIEGAMALGFDWKTMRVPGSHPNCVFLVDHAAIESRYSKVLAELHHFDLPTGKKES